MKHVKCVGFIVLKANKFLVEKRAIDDEIDAGKVAIPGGHVEKGEDLEGSLIRECKEELDITPLEYKFVYNCPYITELEIQDCYYYAVTKWAGKISQKDSGSLKWISFKQKELLDINEDRQAVDHLQNFKTK